MPKLQVFNSLEQLNRFKCNNRIRAEQQYSAILTTTRANLRLLFCRGLHVPSRLLALTSGFSSKTLFWTSHQRNTSAANRHLLSTNTLGYYIKQYGNNMVISSDGTKYIASRFIRHLQSKFPISKTELCVKLY